MIKLSNQDGPNTSKRISSTLSSNLDMFRHRKNWKLRQDFLRKKNYKIPDIERKEKKGERRKSTHLSVDPNPKSCSFTLSSSLFLVLQMCGNGQWWKVGEMRELKGRRSLSGDWDLVKGEEEVEEKGKVSLEERSRSHEEPEERKQRRREETNRKGIEPKNELLLSTVSSTGSTVRERVADREADSTKENTRLKQLPNFSRSRLFSCSS